ncbi:hypothetical protein Pcinc_026337 [Petrolisthes cinctipes]|uniref:F-box only protein 32 n=1 Tax=Petrolisthes cinctipes TaxID=88211 RepID=A0AAE1KBS1_PETCI|nr:hypothetical protein Pcinc_026337 [Petrolisthes cinctipes]
MPIFSLDWRDPGDKWVKTNDGWEKEKVTCNTTLGEEGVSQDDIENVDPNPLLLSRRGSRGEQLAPQPHCRIYTRNTKEVAGFNGLGETLMKLDCINAVRDIRRFRYICKLLDLLITQKLNTLSGGAQKMLFGMVEEVAHEVTRSQQNLHVLQHLLQELHKRLKDYLWGNKLGSTILWKQHTQRLHDINAIATTIQISQPGDDVHPTLQEVPEEVIREILKRLDNHTDIRSAGEAYSVMARVSEEKTIWRQLCRFHWSAAQIEHVIHRHRELQVQRNWHKVYDRLRRTYGLREEYAEKLCLCRNCSCIFWESYGHPCRTDGLGGDDDDTRPNNNNNNNTHPHPPHPHPPHPHPAHPPHPLVEAGVVLGLGGGVGGRERVGGGGGEVGGGVGGGGREGVGEGGGVGGRERVGGRVDAAGLGGGGRERVGGVAGEGGGGRERVGGVAGEGGGVGVGGRGREGVGGGVGGEIEQQQQQQQNNDLDEAKSDIIYVSITPQQFLKYFHL